MKKILSTLLIITLMLFTLVGCGSDTGAGNGGGNEGADDVQIRVGFMGGPTGMGLSKLMHDNGGLTGNDKYTFEQTANVNLATAALTAGALDIVCVPTTDAATYYSKDSDITVLAINTLNTLFLLTDANNSISSFSELEGKTVYTCSNGTPKVILQYLLDALGINATVSTTVNDSEIVTPAQLGEQLIAGSISIAVVPEPIVTSSMLKIASNKNPDISYSIDMNLDTVWSSIENTPIAMGCLLAKRSFVENHKSAVNRFLEEYKASVDFMVDPENLDTAAAYVVESTVMAAAPAAKKALTNLSSSIVYIDGVDMKNTLVNFCRALSVTAPSDDKFYYEK